MVGELAVHAEMHLVLREAGMLPAQRLARCAAGLLLDPRQLVPLDLLSNDLAQGR